MLALAFALAAQTAPADADEQLFAVEDAMVTTASRAAEPLRTAPSSISVVSRAEIDAFGYTTVLDAVEPQRGVFATRYDYSEIGIRGFAPLGSFGDRLQMQIDGHTVSEEFTNISAVDTDLLTDLDMVSQIELVRGTGSVLHGSQAIFGVINARTLDHVPAHRASVGGGFNGAQWNAHADVATQLDNGVGGFVTGGLVYGAPYDLALDNTDVPWLDHGVAKGVGELTGGAALGKMWWKDFTLEAYAQRNARQLPYADYETIPGDLRTREAHYASFVELRYEPELAPGWRLSTRLSADTSGYRGDYPYNDPTLKVGTENSGGYGVLGEARLTAQVFDALRLIGGVQAEVHPNVGVRGTYVDGTVPYVDVSQQWEGAAALVDALWTPARFIDVEVGARVDGATYPDLTDATGKPTPRVLGNLSPRVAVVLVPDDDNTVKLLAGRAYRAPSLFELTYNDGGVTWARSPGLDPELATSLDAEYTYRTPFDTWITAALFANALEGVIDLQGTGDSADPLVYTNLGDPIFASGAELEVRREAKDGILFMATAALQHVTRADPISGPPVVNAPVAVLGARGALPLEGRRVVANARVRFETGRLDDDGTRTIDPLLLDLGLTGAFDEMSLSYAVGVKNVLDWKWTNPGASFLADAQVPQAGRSFVVELRFAL